MLVLKDFEAFNNYVGLPKPLDSNIDIGYYDGQHSLLQSAPVMIDFYRISIKSNYIDLNKPDKTPVIGVFFSSPENPLTWNIAPDFKGMYVQISKKFIDENRFLFQNYLGYGEHEALLLTESEEKEIRSIFKLLFRHYQEKQNNYTVLLSYVHVLISLVESYYHRQFSADIKKYNHIVSEFQQLLKDYYNAGVNQLPSVQYFAEKLHLSPNYLGDIIKYFTKKTAIETIHDAVIAKAKQLLKESDLNNAEIAYELGFKYPNYFSKFFKKHTLLTPKEFRTNTKTHIAP